MMSPTALLSTASGLMMVSVRCKVFISVVSPWWLVVHGLDWFAMVCVAGFSASVPLNPGSDAQHLCDRITDGRGRLGYTDPGYFHSFDLLFRRSLPAGNNGAGMPHAPSRRRG